MLKQIGSIPLYETDDYKIFKIMTDNRSQNKLQTNKLARVIRLKGNITELAPLIVNEKHEVIDGQHRLWATELVAEEGGVKHKIFFMVREGLGAEEAIKLNSGAKPWNPDDFAKYHAKNGNSNYKTFLAFRERYELNAEVLMRYLAPHDGKRQEFQDGGFVVESEAKSKAWCNKLESMKIYYQDFKHRSFALAYLDLVSFKRYDHDRMIKQLDQYASELIKIPLKNKPMREAMIEIYNRKVADKELFED
jgi:hypothetical protein